MYRDLEKNSQRKKFDPGQHPTFDDLNNCFSVYPLADLDSENREAITEHVSYCSNCSKSVQFIREADKAWNDTSPLTPVDQEMVDSLEQWLNSKPFASEEVGAIEQIKPEKKQISYTTAYMLSGKKVEAHSNIELRAGTSVSKKENQIDLEDLPINWYIHRKTNHVVFVPHTEIRFARLILHGDEILYLENWSTEEDKSISCDIIVENPLDLTKMWRFKGDLFWEIEV